MNGRKAEETDRSPQPILTVRDLGLILQRPEDSIEMLAGIEFRLEIGSVLGVVGESGCGKTLLCKALLRLLPPRFLLSGEVIYAPPGEDETNLLAAPTEKLRNIRGKGIGILFQEPLASLNPIRACGQQVFDALPNLTKDNTSIGQQRVEELLELVGLDNPRRVSRSYPHELSGGMVQRVALAAALAGDPHILIADEPTTALDASSRVEILHTLSRLGDELGMSVIVVSHDVGTIAAWADTLLIMYGGRVVESGNAPGINAGPTHPYTEALFDTADAFAGGRKPVPIPGEPPPATDQPLGCRFHPRCSYADEQCSLVEPPFTASSLGGKVRCHYPLA